jgi:hydrogenase maturation factor/phosphoglycolate phosphatase-like HAD superfamily hydrolase
MAPTMKNPRGFRIEHVFFHLEGALMDCDAQGLKAALACPPDKLLPAFIRGLRDPARRSRALSTLDRLERRAAAGWPPRTGAKSALAACRANRLGVVVFSRHGRAAVLRSLRQALGLRQQDLDLVLCRGELPLPGRMRHPLPTAAKILGCTAGALLVVSSEEDLIAAARADGAVTVRIAPGSAPEATAADFSIGDLRELGTVLRQGTPLPAGKVPNDILKELLADLDFEDPSLLITPRVGEDIAAVDVAPEEVLVLKSDPITFATDAIGQYAVLVNANDIATAGARPRWMLTTLLLPVGSTASMVRGVTGELSAFCRKWRITLCGGHTEITDAVTRPVVSGMMAGTVRRKDLIDKGRMRTGDLVWLTKAAAAEGTAIIAREFSGRLLAGGMKAEKVDACRRFLDLISIMPEAGIAAAAAGTSAMHDVTEGGIATALEELGAAGGFVVEVALDKIPVFPETRRVCRLLGVHPLGLIGSGSLLICCRPSASDGLGAALQRAGIMATCIGEVAEKGSGVRAFRRGRPARWTSFAVDEIARLFTAERSC